MLYQPDAPGDWGQMLETDSVKTSTNMLKTSLCVQQCLKNAKLINKPGLVMQAESDKAIVSEASHTLYNTLVNNDKIWKTFPGYEHDSEFEADRTLLDNEIVSWITEHVKELTASRIA